MSNYWKQQVKKRHQHDYWLRKAIEWGIPTEGREEQASKDAEARYRKEYRHRKAEEAVK